MKHTNITPITPNTSRQTPKLEASERFKRYSQTARECGVTRDPEQPKEVHRFNIFSGSKG